MSIVQPPPRGPFKQQLTVKSVEKIAQIPLEKHVSCVEMVQNSGTGGKVELTPKISSD